MVQIAANSMPQEYLSALIQGVAGIGFAGLILILSVVFGRRAKQRNAQDVPYECGNVPEGVGSPGFFSIKYYQVAVLFLIFDLEVVLLYPWALNFKDFMYKNATTLGAMAVFISALLVVFFYAVGKGVIVWHREPRPNTLPTSPPHHSEF